MKLKTKLIIHIVMQALFLFGMGFAAMEQNFEMVMILFIASAVLRIESDRDESWQVKELKETLMQAVKTTVKLLEQIETLRELRQYDAKTIQQLKERLKI